MSTVEHETGAKRSGDADGVRFDLKRAGFETEEVQVISTFPQTVVLNSVANVYRSQ